MADDPTQNYTLSTNQIKAARLTAEDELTDEEIAGECGITRKSLWSWRQRDDFRTLVAQHREAFLNQALEEGFADKRARLKVLNGIAQDTARHFAKKGYEREEVKIAANGEHVSYQVFDQGRVAQFRGVLDDIAKEMGERKTSVELGGDADNPLVLGLIGVDLGRV